MVRGPVSKPAGARPVPAPKKQPKQKRIQFSQKQCLYADLLVALVLFLDFILKWNGKEGMSDVAIAVVSMFGGFATGGYFALSGARDCSKNKHHIKEDNDS